MDGSDRMIRKLSLSLSTPVPPEALAALSRPEGILHIRADDEAGRTISVTYDLRHATLACVDSWLAANGVHLSDGFLSRLHRRWLSFKDDNRRDQAAIVHQCCSVPPRKH
ncbi:hypothetical protein WV31_07485 [Magnetospirillum sp. ME-1]|uniref:hypothetical protein n=1 Tax=Magnetospirillum sp. ME-1 TaxID=1639348 RepID=UPI000A1797FC|nr:hypothetical protein [Magnetospirillum sp. ME-1]ARJ65506.1 hypothetical protein WV31_07485 [Magnetospirillum sp. ME-1]